MIAKMKRHRLLCILIPVILLAVIAGCIIFSQLRRSSEGGATQKKDNVVSLEKQTLTKSISATGTVESAQSKTVSAKVSSLTVKKVGVKVGDKVKKGQSLVSFDESSLSDALKEAEENLSAARSDAQRSQSSTSQQLSNAKETAQAEKKKAAREVQQAKEALEKAKKQVAALKKKAAAASADKKQAAQEALAKAQEARAQAKSSYENALSSQESTLRQNEANIQNAQNAVDNASSSSSKTIREAKNQVAAAKTNLKNCSVKAPITGIVTAVNVESGDTYNGGSMFQIDDTSSFTVNTTVDEYDISSVSVGQRAVILTEATGKEELSGEITFVAPSTDSTASSANAQGEDGAVAASANTTSSDGYQVIIRITDSSDKLKMGLTAKCSLILEEAKDVFAVPYDAVHKNDSGDSVIYVAEDKDNTDKYEEVSVTQGMESDYYVEISGDGLEEGMLVIIPTDETEDASSQDDSSQNGFGFNGGPGMGQGMPNGSGRSQGSGSGRGFKNGGGGNPPAAPGN